MVVVVIPTYNEAANLAAMTTTLFAHLPSNMEILIIDDNSPDGTGEIADQLAQQYPNRFFVIHRPAKLGLGTAYVTGFKWALDKKADYIVQMDADFSHSPSYLPQMLYLMKDYDVVVGSRYVPGGQLDQHWSFGRRLLSWWANSVWVRLALGVKSKDATAGFKCWKADALQRLPLENIYSNGYIFQAEMCYLAEKAGLRIKEIPIYFEDRRIGKSKMDMRVKIEAALSIFKIRNHHRSV